MIRLRHHNFKNQQTEMKYSDNILKKKQNSKVKEYFFRVRNFKESKDREVKMKRK